MHHHVNQDEFLTIMISIISKIVVQIKKNKINVDWWNIINYNHQPQQVTLKVLLWSKIDSTNLTLVNPALSVLSSLLWWETKL